MTETTKRRRELLASLQQSAERIYLRLASKPDETLPDRINERPLSKSAAEDMDNATG